MAEKQPSGVSDQNARATPSSTRVYSWVFLISCMFLCIYFSRAVFGPLLPSIEREFAITHAASTRLMLYVSVGYALGIFLSGYTATRVRPRLMAGWSVAGSGLLMVCLGMTANLAFFPALLILLGLVGGHYLNGGMTFMRHIVPPSQWSMAVALHETGPLASFLIVPVLAETGAAAFGWRFVIMGLGWVCVACGLLFIFITRGRRIPSPKLSLAGLRAVIKNPMAWLFAWLAGIGVAGEIAAYSVLTIYLTGERGMEPESAAYLLSLSRLASPVTVFLGGWLCNRFGSKRTLALCLASFAFSLWLMAAPWNAAYLAGMFLQPTVCAMIFPPIFTFLVEQFATENQPTVMALGMPLGCLLGIGIIPALLGVCGDTIGFAAGFAILGAVVAATLLTLPLIRKPAVPL